MFCPNCGATAADNATYCPNCGTALTASTGSAASYSAPSSRGVTYSERPEENGRRIAAYLIDVIPMLLLSTLHFVPVIGWMLYGLIHACYWLLRDVNGASLGKLALGDFVASTNGTPASTQQRILRNVPLAIPGLFGMIPFLGLIFELVLAFIIFSGEAILLLATGRRLGDRIAGTTVFRKF